MCNNRRDDRKTVKPRPYRIISICDIQAADSDKRNVDRVPKARDPFNADLFLPDFHEFLFQVIFGWDVIVGQFRAGQYWKRQLAEGHFTAAGERDFVQGDQIVGQ